MMKQRVKLVPGVFGRILIVSAEEPKLAWSGSRFVPHEWGLSCGGVHVSNFSSRDQARTHALTCGLEVIDA